MHEMSKELHTGHCSLQPQHLCHQQTHWAMLCCPGTDLNWLIQGNTGVGTFAGPACLRKAAPQHALLYTSKCKKPEENLGKLKTVLKMCELCFWSKSLMDPVISPQFLHQCSWVGSCRWQSDLVFLKHLFQGSLNPCGVRRILCRISGVSPGA